jgi:hypothetical protein
MPIIKIVPMPGPGGASSADLADFVFENDGDGQSSMTIHNHDMRIQTTRTANQDADIDINSADDVWITSNDTLELTSVTDEVRIYTNDGDTQWAFRQNGDFSLPSGNAAISSGVSGTVVVDSRVVTFYSDYLDSANGLNQTEAVYLPVNEDTQWFSNNTYSTSTITFADSTSVQVIAIYDATNQGTPAMIFQWSGNQTKTFEETFPLVVTGNITQPKNRVSVKTNNSTWTFEGDGDLVTPTLNARIINTVVPGDITLSAYSGVNLSFADTQGAGLKFPDDTIQTTAYTGGATGSFTSADGKTITVTNGLITGIE